MSATLQPPPTASMTVVSGAAGVFPTTYGYYPAEGSRVVSAQYNWATRAGYAEDLSQLIARGVQTTIQGVFIDNSGVGVPVTLAIGGSDQVLVCPAFFQGIFPLFFTGTPGFTISVPSLTNAVTRCCFVNVPVQTGMWPTTAPALDSSGAALVDTESTAALYAAVASFSTIIGATDIFTVYGSATKTVRIHEIYMTVGNTVVGINVIIRSAVDTGGPASPIVIAAMDQNNPAASATANFYATVPATVGSAIGVVDGFNATPAAPVDRVYGVTDQAIVLRGVGQGMAISLGGVPASPFAVNIRVKWTEV